MSRVSLIGVSDGDWYGLYLDGMLQYEGHSIPAFEWLRVFSSVGIAADGQTVDVDPDSFIGFPTLLQKLDVK